MHCKQHNKLVIFRLAIQYCQYTNFNINHIVPNINRKNTNNIPIINASNEMFPVNLK